MDRDCSKGDWFQELCALSVIGELTPAEYAELEHHLTDCSSCRSAYADFHRIASYDMGLTAISQSLEEAKANGDVLDEEGMFARFMERARREKVSGRTVAIVGNDSQKSAGLDTFLGWFKWLGRPAAAYTAVALLALGATGLGAYRIEEGHLSPALAQLRNQAKDWQGRAQQNAEQQKSTSEMLAASESQRSNLQKLLADAQAKYADLQVRMTDLQSRLSTAQAHSDELAHDLQAAHDGEDQRDKSVADLQSDLQQLKKRTAQQETIIAGLRDDLRSGEQAKNDEAGLRLDESEASQLFGARDLHIVDVYDVEGSGKTRRTYGRVFFVADKLLVFYAFDLQDKRKDRDAAGFQAWGYSDKDMNKPDNLGLFYLDDAKIGRWALKVHDPAVLERVDAVFVTLEPPHGSPYPRGRKLLYANLAGPANHP